MKLTDAKTEAAKLYARCDEVPARSDFSFPSWLLSLSDPEKWDNVGEVLTNKDRAQSALNDAQYFCKVFRGTEHEMTADEIGAGVYDLVMEFPYEA